MLQIQLFDIAQAFLGGPFRAGEIGTLQLNYRQLPECRCNREAAAAVDARLDAQRSANIGLGSLEIAGVPTQAGSAMQAFGNGWMLVAIEAAAKLEGALDVFARDLDAAAAGQDAARAKSALLVFRGWGLERQLGFDRRTLIEGLRADIKAMQDALPEKYPYIHGVAEVEKPVDLKVSIRGSAYHLGDTAPRGFLSVLSPGDPMPFKNGSRRLELAQAIASQNAVSPVGSRLNNSRSASRCSRALRG